MPLLIPALSVVHKVWIAVWRLGGNAIEVPLLFILLFSLEIRVRFEPDSILMEAQILIFALEGVKLLFRSLAFFVATNHPRLLLKNTTFWEELEAMFIDDC